MYGDRLNQYRGTGAAGPRVRWDAPTFPQPLRVMINDHSTNSTANTVHFMAGALNKKQNYPDI